MGYSTGATGRRAATDTEYRWKSTTKNVTTAAGGVVSRCPRVKQSGSHDVVKGSR